MAKRLFDIIFSLIGLVVLAPVFLVVGVAIRLTSQGPVLFRARRAGRGGETFVMHKFRTMHHWTSTPGSSLTGANDRRVYPLGRFLRRTKLDETPQLWDIFRGKMSFVGPRPEDPRIVEEAYTAEQLKTLDVLPGLTSPGSLFYYIYGDSFLTSDDPEQDYVEHLLPAKLAIDLAYQRRATFLGDLRIILCTVEVILLLALRKRHLAAGPRVNALLGISRAFAEAHAPAPR